MDNKSFILGKISAKTETLRKLVEDLILVLEDMEEGKKTLDSIVELEADMRDILNSINRDLADLAECFQKLETCPCGCTDFNLTKDGKIICAECGEEWKKWVKPEGG